MHVCLFFLSILMPDPCSKALLLSLLCSAPPPFQRHPCHSVCIIQRVIPQFWYFPTSKTIIAPISLLGSLENEDDACAASAVAASAPALWENRGFSLHGCQSRTFNLLLSKHMHVSSSDELTAITHVHKRRCVQKSRAGSISY